MESYYTLDELVDLEQKGQLRSVSNINYIAQNQVTQAKSHTYQDVHQFDGKLSISTPSIKTFTKEEKELLLSKLLTILQNPLSKLMATKIIADSNMVDGANNINPSDMLASILCSKMTKDIFLLLEEQLADNFMLGQCPMGRTNRMAQIMELVC